MSWQIREATFNDERLFNNISINQVYRKISPGVAKDTIVPLLLNRLPTEKKFVAGSTTKTKDELAKLGGVGLMRSLTKSLLENVFLTVELQQATRDDIKSFPKEFGDWKRLFDVESFLHPIAETAIYIDEANTRCVIITHKGSNQLVNATLSVFPRFFPGLFKDKPLTENEIELLMSLNEADSRHFEETAKKIYDGMGIEELKKQRLLEGYEKMLQEKAIKAENDKIEELRDRVRAYDNELGKVIKELNNAVVRYESLKYLAETDKGTNELRDYFVANKNLILINRCDDTIEFIAKTYLDSYDPEMYERYSKRGDIFRNYTGIARADSPFKEEAARKKLLDNIFGENAELRVRVCGYFSLDIYGNVTSRRGYQYPAIVNDWLPNPHLQIHNCMNNNLRPIKKAAQNGNMLAAVEQCIASARNLNLSEVTQTVRPFFEWIFNANGRKIIELPDRTAVTPEEALAWLNAKEEKKEEKHEAD